MNAKTPSEKREVTQFIKDFRVMRDYKDDKDVNRLYDARTIDEKLQILQEIKEDRSGEDYKNLKKDLKKKEIISSQLWKELVKQDR